MNFLSNSDGLIDDIYYYLWMKCDIIKQNFYDVAIPDTIIYNSGLPQAWYFQSKQTGEILLHKPEFRQDNQIREKFLQHVGPSKIVAQFIYINKTLSDKANSSKEDLFTFQTKKKQIVKQCNKKDKISIIYFDEQLFNEFLDNRDRPKRGILQKFIEPYAHCESLIQAVWSPTLCILSKRKNFKSISETLYDAQERCATFGSPDFHSRTVALQGHEISQQIRTLCYNIVQRIRAATYDKESITRAVFYFKPGTNNRMYFTYCSSLRTTNEEITKQVSNKPLKIHNHTPIALGENYQEPEGLSQRISYSIVKPAIILNNIKCYDCQMKCQEDNLYRVPYSLICSYHEFNLRRRLKAQFQELVQRDLQNRIEVKQISRESRPQLLTRVFQRTKSQLDLKSQDPSKSYFQVQNKVQSYVQNTDILIPPIIRKIHPQMDFQSFRQQRRNDSFLNKLILLCQTCFLQYSSNQQEVTGVNQPNDQDSNQIQVLSARPGKHKINFKQVFKKFQAEQQSTKNLIVPNIQNQQWKHVKTQSYEPLTQLFTARPSTAYIGSARSTSVFSGTQKTNFEPSSPNSNVKKAFTQQVQTTVSTKIKLSIPMKPRQVKINKFDDINDQSQLYSTLNKSQMDGRVRKTQTQGTMVPFSMSHYRSQSSC